MAFDEIQLMQFFVCEDFEADAQQDSYTAGKVQCNLSAPEFPHNFSNLVVVTCWRKDSRFHKEVIEYETDYGSSIRTPHMDIEPVRGSVIFRWHRHPFPPNFPIEKPTHLTIRVFLDMKLKFESYLLIEKKG